MGWGRGDKGIDGSVQRMRLGGRGRPHALYALEWEGRGDRGLTVTSTHAAWEGGRPHASYALEWEGRDTIWLNGLFRGFAVYNVLAGKVTIG